MFQRSRRHYWLVSLAVTLSCCCITAAAVSAGQPARQVIRRRLDYTERRGTRYTGCNLLLSGLVGTVGECWDACKADDFPVCIGVSFLPAHLNARRQEAQREDTNISTAAHNHTELHLTGHVTTEAAPAQINMTHTRERRDVCRGVERDGLSKCLLFTSTTVEGAVPDERFVSRLRGYEIDAEGAAGRRFFGHYEERREGNEIRCRSRCVEQRPRCKLVTYSLNGSDAASPNCFLSNRDVVNLRTTGDENYVAYEFWEPPVVVQTIDQPVAATGGFPDDSSSAPRLATVTMSQEVSTTSQQLPTSGPPTVAIQATSGSTTTASRSTVPVPGAAGNRQNNSLEQSSADDRMTLIVALAATSGTLLFIIIAGVLVIVACRGRVCGERPPHSSSPGLAAAPRSRGSADRHQGNTQSRRQRMTNRISSIFWPLATTDRTPRGQQLKSPLSGRRTVWQPAAGASRTNKLFQTFRETQANVGTGTVSYEDSPDGVTNENYLDIDKEAAAGVTRSASQLSGEYHHYTRPISNPYCVTPIIGRKYDDVNHIDIGDGNHHPPQHNDIDNKPATAETGMGGYLCMAVGSRTVAACSTGTDVAGPPTSIEAYDRSASDDSGRHITEL